MSIKSRTISDGKIAIIEIKGSLIGDEETDLFREHITDFIEQGNKSLIINLEKLNYMNSSGIGAIITAHSSYKKNGGEIKLVGLSQNIQNLFAVTRLVEIFDVHENMNEAIASYATANSK